MDLITDLPTSKGYDAILTIVDQGCSKATKFIPCTKTITGDGVAQLYLRHLFPWFGLPKRVISDRDPRFTSTFATELTSQLNIQQNLSTAFHPHTDGQTERMNAWVEQYLRHWVNQQEQNDWVAYLPIAEFAHNVTIVPTPIPEWNMNDNMKRLVNRARTLSKLRSNGEEDYEEEWANIGRMVSAEAFEFGLHAGEDAQEGARD